MSKIFLSHSSANNVEAVALRDWLIAAGFAELFLDLDPLRGIAAGERWEKALIEAANRCEAVVFLVSKEWLASGWCRKEYGLAQKLNKRLFGVIIDDTKIEEVPPEIRSDWQLISIGSGTDHATYPAKEPRLGMDTLAHFSRSGLEQLNAGLEKAGLNPKYFEWPPRNDPDRSPYPGLSALDTVDAGIFFGREAQTIEALDRLRGLRESRPPRLLVILGASGAGKSSFLRAGLWQRLRRDDRHFVPLPVLRPGRAALYGDTGLVAVLTAALDAAEIPAKRSDVEAAVREGPAAVSACLRALVTKFPPRGGQTESVADVPTLVLPIDQAEELFLSSNVLAQPSAGTTAGPGNPEGKLLLEILNALLHLEIPELIAVLSIRTDSYQQLQTAEELGDIQQQTMSLPPLPQGAYTDVIEGPARRLAMIRRFEIKPELTNALLAAIETEGGQGDKLPLLALTLQRLYDEAGPSGQITAHDFNATKGIRGSIDAAVERALLLADVDDRIPRERSARLALLRRALIPWLAGIDPLTNTPRRNIARYDEIPVEARPLIDHLINVHLISSDTTPSGVRTLEPAHDALLRQWGLLRGWLEEDLAALSILESVKKAAGDYFANDKRREWLVHTAGRLEDAERESRTASFEGYCNDSDREYLKACRDVDDERTERELRATHALLRSQKKTVHRTRVALGLAGLMLLIVGAFAHTFKTQYEIIKSRTRRVLQEESSSTDAEARHALTNGLPSRAIAYLTRALVLNPQNSRARERLVAVIRSTVLLLPACPALVRLGDLSSEGSPTERSSEIEILQLNSTEDRLLVSNGTRAFLLEFPSLTLVRDFSATVSDSDQTKLVRGTGSPMTFSQNGELVVVYSPDGSRVAELRDSKTGTTQPTGRVLPGRSFQQPPTFPSSVQVNKTQLVLSLPWGEEGPDARFALPGAPSRLWASKDGTVAIGILEPPRGAQFLDSYPTSWLWSAKYGDEGFPMIEQFENGALVEDASFLSDGSMFAVQVQHEGYDGPPLTLPFRLGNGRKFPLEIPVAGEIRKVVFSKSNLILAASEGGVLSVWHLDKPPSRSDEWPENLSRDDLGQGQGGPANELPVNPKTLALAEAVGGWRLGEGGDLTPIPPIEVVNLRNTLCDEGVITEDLRSLLCNLLSAARP